MSNAKWEHRCDATCTKSTEYAQELQVMGCVPRQLNLPLQQQLNRWEIEISIVAALEVYKTCLLNHHWKTHVSRSYSPSQTTRSFHNRQAVFQSSFQHKWAVCLMFHHSRAMSLMFSCNCVAYKKPILGCLHLWTCTLLSRLQGLNCQEWGQILFATTRWHCFEIQRTCCVPNAWSGMFVLSTDKRNVYYYPWWMCCSSFCTVQYCCTHIYSFCHKE